MAAKSSGIPVAMTGAPTGDEIAENRAFGASMAQAFQAAYSQTLSISMDMAKWIQTSLLAINGAAAVVTFPVQMPPALKVAACACFVSGVLLALLGAHLQVSGISKLSHRYGQAIGYWTGVAANGWRLEEMESTKDLEKAALKMKFWPTIAGWSAVFLFVVGCVITAVGALQGARC